MIHLKDFTRAAKELVAKLNGSVIQTPFVEDCTLYVKFQNGSTLSLYPLVITHMYRRPPTDSRSDTRYADNRLYEDCCGENYYTIKHACYHGGERGSYSRRAKWYARILAKELGVPFREPARSKA